MHRLLLAVAVVGLLWLAGCTGENVDRDLTDRLGTDTAPAAASPTAGPGSADSTVADGGNATADAASEPTAPQASLVTDSLVLHFEGDAGVSTEGDAVTRWADQAGDNDLTAEGAPTLRRDALNGHDVVSFDGEDDLLNRSGDVEGLPRLNEDRTMFAVVRYDGVGSGGLGYGRQHGDGNHAFQFAVDEDGLLELNAFGKPNDYIVPINGTQDGWMTRGITLEDGKFVHYVNGERYDSGSHEFDTKLARIVMGAEIDNEPHVDMQVAAMLVYNRSLSDAERRQVEAYLQSKYVPAVAGETNARPTATDDFVTVSEGGSVTVDVLANDEDSDGSIDADSVVAVSRSRGQRGPLFGSVTVDRAEGTLTYDHAGECTVDFYPCGPGGADSFTYTVRDEDGKPSNVAMVHVTVTNGNNASSLDETVEPYDEDGDGRIGVGELGAAAADYASGLIAITVLSDVADAYAGG